MREIGKYIAIAGLFAIVLDFVNMVPRVLMWIYTWGETTAWGIKTGLIVIGAILYLTSKKPLYILSLTQTLFKTR